MVNFPSVMDAERWCGSSDGDHGGSNEDTCLGGLWLYCWRCVAMLAVVLVNVREVGKRLPRTVASVMQRFDVATESVLTGVSGVDWRSVPVLEVVASAMGVLAMASLFVGYLAEFRGALCIACMVTMCLSFVFPTGDNAVVVAEGVRVGSGGNAGGAGDVNNGAATTGGGMLSDSAVTNSGDAVDVTGAAVRTSGDATDIAGAAVCASTAAVDVTSAVVCANGAAGMSGPDTCVSGGEKMNSVRMGVPVELCVESSVDVLSGMLDSPDAISSVLEYAQLAVHYAVNLCICGAHVDMFLVDDCLSSDELDVESLFVVSRMLEVVESRCCCKDAVPAVVVAQLAVQQMVNEKQQQQQPMVNEKQQQQQQPMVNEKQQQQPMVDEEQQQQQPVVNEKQQQQQQQPVVNERQQQQQPVVNKKQQQPMMNKKQQQQQQVVNEKQQQHQPVVNKKQKQSAMEQAAAVKQSAMEQAADGVEQQPAMDQAAAVKLVGMKLIRNKPILYKRQWHITASDVSMREAQNTADIIDAYESP